MVTPKKCTNFQLLPFNFFEKLLTFKKERVKRESVHPTSHRDKHFETFKNLKADKQIGTEKVGERKKKVSTHLRWFMIREN